MNIHLVFVTWKRVVCLMWTLKVQGLKVNISGRPRVPMLQMLYVTFTHLRSKAQTVVHNCGT